MLGYMFLQHVKWNNTNLVPWANVGFHALQQVKCNNKNLLPWENVGFHLLQQVKCTNKNSLPWENIGSHLLQPVTCNKVIIRIYPRRNMLDLIFCNKSTVIIRIYLSRNLRWDPTFFHGSNFLLLHLTCCKIWWIRWSRDVLGCLWSVLDHWWRATALCGGLPWWYGNMII